MSQTVNKNAPKKNAGSAAITENWVPVRQIKNGVITLRNKELVAAVKIEPRNIFILDQIQQDSIINALKNCYNQFNFEWWLIAADRPVDISVYVSQLELMLNQAMDPARRKIVMQDLEKANMFINNQVVDTEYYIMFKESNFDRVNDKIRLIINGFAGCSLAAGQASDDELRVILDNFLNGGVRTDFNTVVVNR